MPEPVSIVDALTPVETALLDGLLVARPDLRADAEARATASMSVLDADAVAGEVTSALVGLGIEELNGRAGYRPGMGYVHEVEAADEILDEAS